MLQYVISPAASRDIIAILERSEILFGKLACRRYETLILQAIRDVAENPTRAGSVRVDIISAKSFVYHLKHSRRNVSREIGRVRQPSHFLLCRINGSSTLEIARVVHDKMLINQRLLGDG